MHIYWFGFLVTCMAMLSSGCNTNRDELAKTLREDFSIIRMMEYEKMLQGNLEAEYVGDANCEKKCHTHDKIRKDFAASTMGAQLTASSSGMAIVVNCESCHGPASILLDAVKDLEEKKDHDKIKEIMRKNLLHFDELPAGARSLICLKCHTTNATFNLHNWNTSVHALSEVSCSDCHPLHKGADLITAPRDIQKMCSNCHQDVNAEFTLPSHHPVKEHKMFCTDCHEPHGNANNKFLLEASVKETCCRCHPEKAGPFLFEHGDVTENCITCHAPHGSMVDNLLELPQTFLCKQCHQEHRVVTDGAITSMELKGALSTRCTDCHSEVHGTDIPGVTKGGKFTQ